MRVSRPWTVVSLLILASLALGGRLPGQEQAPQVPVKEPAAAPSAKAETETDEAAAPKAASSTRAPRPGHVQKVFAVRHVSARQLVELLSVFPATMRYANLSSGTALSVSAPPAVMAAIEGTLKRLDVPPVAAQPSANVELTGYVLEALAQPVEAARVPGELEGVVAQLKSSFTYAAYRVVDTLIARAREGSDMSATAVAEASHDAKGLRASYSLRARRARVSSGDSGRIVHLDALVFEVQVPILIPMDTGSASPTEYRTVGVKADLDIREGQRVVVGKSGVGEAGNAIFLVLSAKVVD